jgi:hypothetical protein
MHTFQHEDVYFDHVFGKLVDQDRDFKRLGNERRILALVWILSSPSPLVLRKWGKFEVTPHTPLFRKLARLTRPVYRAYQLSVAHLEVSRANCVLVYSFVNILMFLDKVFV